MCEHALADAAQILVGIRCAQRLRLLERQPGGDVAVERVVRARLVGDDVDLHVAPRKLGEDLRGIAGEADRERAPLAPRAVKARKRVVEVRGSLVEVAGLDSPLDPPQVDLDAQRRTAQHRDGEGLRAAHPAEPGGHHQPTRERAAEALAGGRGEGLVGALEDALAPDVDPGAGRHLAVHHQPGRVELAEVLPGRPLRDEVRVGDQHARRELVRLERRDGLARLHEQRLVVAQRHQFADDRVVALPVARRLADAAVHDEVLGALRDVRVQVVLEHAQRRLLLPAASARRCLHTGTTLSHTGAI